jgi:hypothetical protein
MKLKKTASKIFNLAGMSMENVAKLLKALLQNDFWISYIHTYNNVINRLLFF